MDLHALNPLPSPTSPTKLAISAEASTAEILQMGPISDCVVDSQWPRELDGKSLQAAGLATGADKLSRVYPGHLPNILEIGHVTHDETRNWWIKLNLEACQAVSLVAYATKPVALKRNVSLAFTMDESTQRDTELRQEA